LRRHLSASAPGEQLPESDLELLERHLEHVTLSSNRLELRLRQTVESAQPGNAANTDPPTLRTDDIATITVPWTSPLPPAARGIIHVPAHNTPIAPSRRESLLTAIAKARGWVDELVDGRVGSFAMLARREGMVERHIRLLLPLAFVSPRIVSNILDGTAPTGLTITALARALPWSWAEQERRLGMPYDAHALTQQQSSASLLNGACMR
jgi:hypothetical protein